MTETKQPVTDHRSYWSFSGVNTERELILARGGVFSQNETSDDQHRHCTPFAHITGANSGFSLSDEANKISKYSKSLHKKDILKKATSKRPTCQKLAFRDKLSLRY